MPGPRGWGALLTLYAMLALLAPARADERDRALIDKVDVRPSPIYGLARIRALISATELRGARIPKDGKPNLTVKIGGAKVSFVTGLSKNAEVEVQAVLVVATTDAFLETLDPIREILKTDLLGPLEKLGPRFQIAVIGYDSVTTGQKRLGPIAAARGALDGLVAEELTSEVALVKAVEDAIALAARARPKQVGSLTRPVVIVVSDGAGIPVDGREEITKLGERAAKQGVRIHGLGFSPQKHRRTLLTLGELSKRSGGTFRWIQELEGWNVALEQLVDQLSHEYVITALAPLDEVSGKRLAVTIESAGGPLEAPPVTLKSPRCGKAECDGDAYCVRDTCIARRRQPSGGGALLWILIATGGLVGVGAVVVIGKAVASRRGPRPIKPAPLPMAIATGAVAVAAPPPAAPAAPPGGPVLIVLSGPMSGQQLPLFHGFTLGKAPGSSLDLGHDGYASTHHAQITFDGATWTLTDLGSTNGTFANGSRVSSVKLFPGMSVRVGSTDVRFWQG